MKLSRNRSSLHQGSTPERALDGSVRSSAGLFRLILHSLLCVAALVLGFRLSGETRLVVVSIKPSHGTLFSNSITRFYRTKSFEAVSGAPYVIDDRRDFTPTSISKSPPSINVKSSRVHVGRHEILIRSWPHPNSVQTLTAHRLIEQVQQEQQRVYGLQERKQFVVITPTYVRAFQAVYISCLIHTLRSVPGPLIWIVIEAGGISSATAELLSHSQLSYHHLAIQEPMPADSRDRKHLEIRLRLEGLRFIRNHRIDGVVIFLDEINTYSLELFDVAQKIDWVGAFSLGIPSPFKVPLLSEVNVRLSQNSSTLTKEGESKLEAGSLDIIEESNILTKFENSGTIQEDLLSRFLLPLTGPVCNPEGHVVGWYAPFEDEQEQARIANRNFEWAGFALNSRMFWEDVSKPNWIKSWDELFGENTSLPDNPLAFLKNKSYIEPLADCGRIVLMWWMGIEAAVGCEFPSRWIISPPLEVVVPSRQTPWSAKLSVQPNVLGSPPPPPPFGNVLSETIIQHGKGRVKGAKPRKGKHRSRHTKEDQAKSHADYAP